jgi:hypothetical protein
MDAKTFARQNHHPALYVMRGRKKLPSISALSRQPLENSVQVNEKKRKEKYNDPKKPARATLSEWSTTP